jgi:hypothetical protein
LSQPSSFSSLSKQSSSPCLPTRTRHSRQTLIRDFFRLVSQPVPSRKAANSLPCHTLPPPSLKAIKNGIV